MAGKVIAVANMKGGVGKTTTVVSLAEALAAEDGASVLVIDLDAQANASFCLAGDALLGDLIDQNRTIDALLEEVFIDVRDKRMKTYICDGVSVVTHHGRTLNISLLASSPELRVVERQLIYTFTENNYSMYGIEGQIVRFLQKELAAVRENYDFIILDCAPGISAFTEVAIRLSDLVAVPTIPDFVSTLGLNAFCSSLWKDKRARKGGLPTAKRPPYVLATRCQDIKEHNERLESLYAEVKNENANFRIFNTVVPQMAAITKALQYSESRPAFLSKWGNKASEILIELSQEVKGALHDA